MASGDDRATIPEGLDGHDLRVGVIRARWNATIVQRLVDGAHRGLSALEVENVIEESVPGCFELPFAARAMAASGRIDAIVCLGVVIRGETTHYEIVAEGAANGIREAQFATSIPIAFGLLTVENDAQALARSEGEGGHNVGEEAAMVAVEMARLRARWS